jgi:glycosyltransferase involved in cell wall biosynthesis
LRVELVGSREHPVAVPDGLPVTLRDPVDYTESLALMRASDALLVVDAPAERSVFLPSKLVDYLGAGRPIVALTPPGAAADLVDRAGGWVADPADPVAGADALAAALRGAAAPSSDAEAVRAAHAAPVVARRMRDIIAGAARR